MVAGVEVPDDDGQPMLSIAHLTTDRTLWDILVLRKQANRIDVESPHLRLRVEGGRTNLGPTLQRLRERPPRTPDSLAVRITDGHIDLLPMEGDAVRATCSDASLELDMSDGPQYQFTLHASVSAAPAPADGSTTVTPSPVEIEAEWRSTYDAGFLLGPGEFSVEGNDVVAAQVAALIPGIADTLHCDGSTDLSLSGSWQEIATDKLSGTVALSAKSEGLTITPLADNQLFPEPVTLDGEITSLSSHFLFSRAEDLLEIGQLQIASRWLNAELTGEVTDVTGNAVVQLTGSAEGDPAPWIDMLPDEVSDHLLLEGVKVSSISVTGPMRPAANDDAAGQVSIAANIGWTTAVAFGLTSTDGELQLGWNGDALTLDPVHVPFNGGHVVSLPDVLFRGEGVVLRFESGVLFEVAEVDEEIARQWLRYLSPLLASATSVNGSLSLSTEGGEVPLNRWQQSEFEGTLTIHEARVSPGPRAQSILSAVRQFRQMLRLDVSDSAETTLLTMPQQDIVLRISGERVHHDQLTLLAGEVEMQSSGSVGFDESLDIHFGLPVDEEWLTDRPLIGAALRGETISLRMGGTLEDPDLDSRPLRDLSVRMGLRAGGNLLFNLLDGDDEEEE
jgi:hypothetical protein